MQCQVPICLNEIQGEGHTHALGDGQHTITICDECEDKRQNFRPEYEPVGEKVDGQRQETQFVWVWKNPVYASFIDAVNCPQCKQEISLEKMWYDERRRITCSSCGTHFDTEFLKPVYLHETEVNDGKGGKKVVRPGDNVEILPVRLCPEDKEHGHYFNEKHVESLRNYLGEGPFEIAHVGLWPCGRVELYVKTRTSSGAGVYASSVMAV